MVLLFAQFSMLTLIVMSNFWDRFISIVVRNLLIPVPFREQLQRGIKVYENNQLTLPSLCRCKTNFGGLTDGNAQWFLQAGKTTSQASDDESSAYQLGVRLPLHPQYGLYAGLANADDVGTFELGNDWTANLGGAGNLAISASVFHGDDGGKVICNRLTE